MHIDEPFTVSAARFRGEWFDCVYNIRFKFPTCNARHVEHDAAHF
jgi:hypothetical protein